MKEADIEVILKLRKDSFASLKIWSAATLLNYCEVSGAEQEECQHMW